MIYFFVHIKVSYYWFNRKELPQKVKDRYYNGEGQEQTAEIKLIRRRSKKRISKKYIQRHERKNKPNEYQAAEILIFCIV